MLVDTMGMHNLERLHGLAYNINCGTVSSFNDIHYYHNNIHDVHIIGHSS